MFVMGNLLAAIAQLLHYVLLVLTWMIIGRVIISWVSADPFNPVVQFINRVTEPILEPIRRLLPVMPIDISPWIAIVLIQILGQFLGNTLYDIAAHLH